MNQTLTDPSQASEKIEVWEEDKTPFRRTLRLDAATYRPDTVFDTASALWSEGGEYMVSRGGNFAYQNRVVPEGTPLRLYGQHEGVVVWNGDIVVPTLIDLRRRGHSGEPFFPGTPEPQRVKHGAVWMSLTPMEMMSQRSGVRLASGTVVVGGLGLGWLLRKVCEKPEVERVVVVEKSEELLEWYGYGMCRRFGKVGDVLCDDIYNQIGKHGMSAKYLLDIWPTYSGASEDFRLRPVRRRLRSRLWAWGIG